MDHLMKSSFDKIFYQVKKLYNSVQGSDITELPLKKYPNTYLHLSELGESHPPYQPTYDFGSKFINEHHKFYSECPVGGENKVAIKLEIPGWLRRDDALKLYELAYFCKGDILELGTYQGLSTSIIATACNDAKNNSKIISIDVNKEYIDKAKENLQSIADSEKIDFVVSDATKFSDNMVEEGKKFGFVFIDHSHEYEPVYQACLRLGKLIKPNSFCLFHDYNDPRNRDEKNKDVKVYQAIKDGLAKEDFEFFGIFGCAGLYKKI